MDAAQAKTKTKSFILSEEEDMIINKALIKSIQMRNSVKYNFSMFVREAILDKAHRILNEDPKTEKSK